MLAKIAFKQTGFKMCKPKFLALVIAFFTGVAVSFVGLLIAQIDNLSELATLLKPFNWILLFVLILATIILRSEYVRIIFRESFKNPFKDTTIEIKDVGGKEKYVVKTDS